MLIWSDLGFLTVVIMIVCGISTRFILETVTGDVNAFEAGNTGIVITMLVSAVLNFGFYKFLTRKQERVVIDKKTGQEIVLVKNHSLFFYSCEMVDVGFCDFVYIDWIATLFLKTFTLKKAPIA